MQRQNTFLTRNLQIGPGVLATKSFPGDLAYSFLFGMNWEAKDNHLEGQQV